MAASQQERCVRAHGLQRWDFLESLGGGEADVDELVMQGGVEGRNGGTGFGSHLAERHGRASA